MSPTILLLASGARHCTHSWIETGGMRFPPWVALPKAKRARVEPRLAMDGRRPGHPVPVLVVDERVVCPVLVRVPFLDHPEPAELTLLAVVMTVVVRVPVDVSASSD